MTVRRVRGCVRVASACIAVLVALGLVAGPSPVAAAATPTPVGEVLVVVDTSGSMAGAPLAAAKEAVTAFVGRLPASVAVGLVAFGPRPVVLAAPGSPRAAVLAAVAALEAGGETALYDTLVTIARDVAPVGDPAGRAVVLLSDGGDTVSAATLSDALNVAATVRVEVIELASPGSSQPALAAIAASGGGSIATVADLGALATTYERTARNLLDGPVTTDGSTAPPTTVAPGPEVAADTAGNTPARLTAVPVVVGGRSPFAGVGLVLLAVALVAVVATGGGRADRLRRLAAAGIVVPGVDRSTARSSAPARAATAFIERSGRRVSLQRALERAGSGLGPEEFVLRVAAVGVLAAVFGTVLVGPIALPVAVLVTPLGARVWLSTRATSRRNRFLAALPDLLQVVVAMLRSGYGFLQALDAVASEADEPARSELRRVLLEVRAGRDLPDALGAMATRLDAADLAWVVDAVEINQTVGGDLAHVLDTVAATIRDRQRLRRQVSALTAEGRVSAYVMMGLPPGVAVALAVMNPAYFARLTEGVGLVLLGGAGVSLVVGYLWMRRMIGSVH